ncbi:hypothetical protein LZ30DRAFT_771293 [Colletotrichum cereale]|nr:hypothetical protein LZ30DRAFT_771293 [Colletotrichum cereale]
MLPPRRTPESETSARTWESPPTPRLLGRRPLSLDHCSRHPNGLEKNYIRAFSIKVRFKYFVRTDSMNPAPEISLVFEGECRLPDELEDCNSFNPGHVMRNPYFPRREPCAQRLWAMWSAAADAKAAVAELDTGTEVGPGAGGTADDELEVESGVESSADDVVAGFRPCVHTRTYWLHASKNKTGSGTEAIKNTNTYPRPRSLVSRKSAWTYTSAPRSLVGSTYAFHGGSKGGLG